MTEQDLDVEIFRIEVKQKGNCLPRVYVYDKGNPISVESIEFSASACEIPRITITKPIFNEEEIKGK